MTSLPDWLVERAALDEVAPASRARLDQADPRELAERIAALAAETAAELAAHPAAPAAAQIDARVTAERLRRKRALQRRIGIASVASAAAVVAIAIVVRQPAHDVTTDPEITRVKGTPRLLAFRQSGDAIEQLDADALVRAGDVIQLRYNGGGHPYGVIASIDGAGVVTLHHPVSEDAPPEATALAAKTTALPNAYALDDAPSFERFLFITADEPIELAPCLAAVRALAARGDSASAALELPARLQQWSLRLRKPSTNQKAPTP